MCAEEGGKMQLLRIGYTSPIRLNYYGALQGCNLAQSCWQHKTYVGTFRLISLHLATS